jgi:hypothetical protein
MGFRKILPVSIYLIDMKELPEQNSTCRRGSVVDWGTMLQAGRTHYVPGVDSASNRNEYRESSWGWRVADATRKADYLTAICEPIV